MEGKSIKSEKIQTSAAQYESDDYFSESSSDGEKSDQDDTSSDDLTDDIDDDNIDDSESYTSSSDSDEDDIGQSSSEDSSSISKDSKDNTHSIKTTDQSTQTEKNLRSIDVQTSPRDTKTIFVQTLPTAKRKVEKRTKSIKKPINNQSHIENDSNAAKTMSESVQRDNINSQKLHLFVTDKQPDTQIKDHQANVSATSPSVETISRSPARRSSPVYPEASAAKSYVEDSGEVEGRSLPSVQMFTNFQVVKPKSGKKKRKRERKKCLSVSPDHRRVPDENKLKPRLRNKSVHDDLFMCKTRIKTTKQTGKGISPAQWLFGIR